MNPNTADSDNAAALYVRVFTSSEDLDREFAPLRMHAALSGLRVRREYSDVIHAGSHKAWTGLDALLEDASCDSFGCVVVRRLSAPAKSLFGLVTFMTKLLKLGIDVISIEDHLQISGENRERFYSVCDALIRAHEAVNSEKGKVQEYYRQVGRPLGRSGRPLKYDKLRIINLHRQGIQNKEIATLLDVPIGVVRYHVQNRKMSERDCDVGAH